MRQVVGKAGATISMAVKNVCTDLRMAVDKCVEARGSLFKEMYEGRDSRVLWEAGKPTDTTGIGPIRLVVLARERENFLLLKLERLKSRHVDSGSGSCDDHQDLEDFERRGRKTVKLLDSRLDA